MKKYLKLILIPLLAILMTALIITMPQINAAGQPPVDLGATVRFAVLAGEQIINSGMTFINGTVAAELGIYPGTNYVGAGLTSTGAVHIGDTLAILAQNDLAIAYNDADSRQPVTRISSELGGLTLTPGTYDSASGTFILNGTLILDALGDPENVFIFKTTGNLTVQIGGRINMVNNAQCCRTFWKVGDSAVIGDMADFYGHVFAMRNISVGSYATVHGQILSRTGTVTLTDCIIFNYICAAPLVPTPEPVTPTPVPTMTPAPPTASPVTTPAPTSPASTPVPATTPGPATASPAPPTVSPVVTPAPATTPKPSTTAPVPTATPAPATTPKPATAAPVPTVTPAPTATPKSATAAPVPTATPAPASGAASPSPSADTSGAVAHTTAGGQLPATSSPAYAFLLSGISMIMLGAAGILANSRRRK